MSEQQDSERYNTDHHKARNHSTGEYRGPDTDFGAQGWEPPHVERSVVHRQSFYDSPGLYSDDTSEMNHRPVQVVAIIIVVVALGIILLTVVSIVLGFMLFL